MSENRPVPPGLEPFWNGSVKDYATLPSAPPIDEGMKERHRIYSLLLMSLIAEEWNGNKYGETGDYGIWRTDQLLGVTPAHDNIYQGGTYLGHNIAALAVDADGRLIDFDFNHNDILDSSVEHAESRLVRRVFALNQIYDSPQIGAQGTAMPGSERSRRLQRPAQRRNLFATAVGEPPANGIAASGTAPTPYTTLLKDVTIYTSLESCAQCSGIMCLASVKEIVYLQWDQGQFLIGNMMWQSTTAQAAGFIAPRPIPGDEYGFEYFDQLNKANDQFSAQVGEMPFFRGGKKVVTTPSVTSFLCTDAAYRIYGAARKELADWKDCRHPDFRPVVSGLSNLQALAQAHDYFAWFCQLDNRGTSHRV